MPSDSEWNDLADAARRASRAAYAPYSRFSVGAAVRAADGSIHSACNIENASYGLSVCAERNAIFHAIAAGASAIVALAVYTPTATATTPCGACRQVLMEFGRDAEVLSICDGAERLQLTAASLLPHTFVLSKR